VKGLIKHLRRIERRAYPKAYRSFGDVRSWADLREYCEGEPKIWTWKGGYCLVTDTELVDLASTSPLMMADLVRLKRQLIDHFGHRDVSLDARESTSWRLIQFFHRRGVLDILRDEVYDWDGEVFHELLIRFRPGR
jgi:hypothetical protein